MPRANIAADHALPLPYRTPTERLIHAREDHARCLRIAASYRYRMAQGELGMVERHGSTLRHARTLRLRFPGQLAGCCA